MASAASRKVDLNDRIIELAASCRFDPDRWSRIAWDWGEGSLADYDGPRDWQSDIFRAIRDHLADPAKRYEPVQISVASGHGIGKSACMGMLSNWAMSCWDDARVLTTANTENQLTTKTSPEIGKWFRLSLTAHWFDVQIKSIKSRDPQHGDSWRQDFIPGRSTTPKRLPVCTTRGRLSSWSSTRRRKSMTRFGKSPKAR